MQVNHVNLWMSWLFVTSLNKCLHCINSSRPVDDAVLMFSQAKWTSIRPLMRERSQVKNSETLEMNTGLFITRPVHYFKKDVSFGVSYVEQICGSRRESDHFKLVDYTSIFCSWKRSNKCVNISLEYVCIPQILSMRAFHRYCLGIPKKEQKMVCGNCWFWRFSKKKGVDSAPTSPLCWWIQTKWAMPTAV